MVTLSKEGETKKAEMMDSTTYPLRTHVVEKHNFKERGHGYVVSPRVELLMFENFPKDLIKTGLNMGDEISLESLEMALGWGAFLDAMDDESDLYDDDSEDSDNELPSAGVPLLSELVESARVGEQGSVVIELHPLGQQTKYRTLLKETKPGIITESNGQLAFDNFDGWPYLSRANEYGEMMASHQIKLAVWGAERSIWNVFLLGLVKGAVTFTAPTNAPLLA